MPAKGWAMFAFFFTLVSIAYLEGTGIGWGNSFRVVLAAESLAVAVLCIVRYVGSE